jgi:hydrogenase small subunit
MAHPDSFQNLCQLRRGRPNCNDGLARYSEGDLFSPVPKPALVWFEGNACSGDSISLLNSVAPGLRQILCSLVAVKYWNALMPDQGTRAREMLFQTAEAGDFILAVEGAIATAGQGRYVIPFQNDESVFTSEELLHYLAPKARFIMAVGTCAAFGGPSAARPNPSGSKGVWELIQDRPVINVPGCPVNPDWFIGTLYHLVRFGLPEVDRYQRPTLFYGQTVHSLCQRRSYFDHHCFAAAPGDAECMYSLGCMGPVAGADCPNRLWNDHLNWPVQASTPCIGCTKSGFPDRSSPFDVPLPEKLPRRGGPDAGGPKKPPEEA